MNNVGKGRVYYRTQISVKIFIFGVWNVDCSIKREDVEDYEYEMNSLLYNQQGGKRR